MMIFLLCEYYIYLLYEYGILYNSMTMSIQNIFGQQSCKVFFRIT